MKLDVGSPGDVPDQTRRTWLAGLAAAGLAAPATAHAATAPVRRALQQIVPSLVGDGVADDTATLQAAMDHAGKSGNCAILIPAGRFRVTRSLRFKSCDRVDLLGTGASTTLIHESDEPLLLWLDGVSVRESSVRNLSIVSAARDKSPGTPAILCQGGTERSLFSHLLFRSEDAAMGSGIVIDNVADTTTLEHCLMWGPIGGTGMRITRGSEVRIIGGRILGSPDPYKGLNPRNVGIHLTGGNGGVHIVTTDVIGLGTAIKIGEPGNTSNREVFLTHATIDSSVHGLVQVDNAYTSIVGCWAASCDEEQILVEESCTGAILSISGGSIFNGGTYGRAGAHHGIVLRAGTFSLNGVAIRHNKGTGLFVGPNVNDYLVSGCRINDNGLAGILDGSGYAFTGNVVTRNGKPLDVRGKNGQITGTVQ